MIVLRMMIERIFLGKGLLLIYIMMSLNNRGQVMIIQMMIMGMDIVVDMKMEGQVMKMRPVPGQRLEIPARGAVELKPGGLHLMLIGLKQQLKPGDKIEVTLSFEKSGDKTVQAEVRAVEGMEGM